LGNLGHHKKPENVGVDYRYHEGYEEGGGNKFPNFVYKHEEGNRKIMCKAWNFDSHIAKMLTMYTFFQTAFVKVIGLSKDDLPVPEVMKIDVWNFVMLDEFIDEMYDDQLGVTSGYMGAMSGGGGNELAEYSRSAHCALLEAGFVDLDSNVLHNVVKQEGTGRIFIVDVDSTVPAYLYWTFRGLFVFGRGDDFEERFGMSLRKRRLGCLPEEDKDDGIDLWEGLSLAASHAWHFGRGVLQYIGKQRDVDETVVVVVEL